MKTALLAGATGLVGGQLLQELLHHPEYGEVIAFVRRPLYVQHPKLKQVTVDYDNPASYADPIQTAHDIFCCLGTTIKTAGSQDAFRQVDYTYPLQLAQLALGSPNLQKFLIITALGSNPASKIFYNRVKGEVERDLQALALPSLHIFRPSLLLGDRQEFRLGERVGSVFSRALAFATPKKYRPIQALTVARAMLRVAQEGPSQGAHVYESDQLQTLGR
ncbi:oxidoreductase [Tumebacillus flagellatus]|nr:oxidoreductase [Tumebacillus flagellatus]